MKWRSKAINCFGRTFVIMEFYDAMNYRGWVKSFSMDGLDTRLEGMIINYVKYLKGLNEEFTDRFEIVRRSDVNKSMIGTFSTKAPYYFIIYINDLEKELLNAGYLMGQLALYLTTKELGSLLIGVEKVKTKAQVPTMLQSSTVDHEAMEEETWMAIMAFGKPERKLRPTPKKLPEYILDKKCIYKSPIDQRVQAIINTAVYAPTKMRIRPYRFLVNELKVHVYGKHEALMTTYQRVTFYLDCGIMLAYLGLKAEEQWMTMVVKQAPKLMQREQKHYRYIISLQFEDQ